ncbi:type 1 periplasmic binding fold superfamily protein [Mangrovimonas sp. DI 80]|uniref:type 1 periplasmic binding fold superfamily protein n=1 Tax=Mangrovimonas sp. DI 80 TaxID=1779330 RepID=UPI000976A764|nr:type 1 periplasmic binding fold superfamily protein [Mangrovimonas sp. DI 80]OMP30654.1 type 1 periplasmic binding fold superfamily protein [Mangrovimonas sp. DI 80]
MKTILKFLPLLFVAPFVTSCSSDDDTPAPVNEEEVITTLTATFVPVGGGTTVTLQTQDLDGDGPDAPVVTVSGAFASNTTYNGSVEFLNELESPAEDITEEVQEEGDEHQIFYTTSNDLGTFSYNDSDADGNPIGVEFTFQTVETSTTLDGILTITLRHEPNKDASGVNEGDITNAGGETDIQTSFNISVE